MTANMPQNETVGHDPGPNWRTQQIRGHELHESIHKGQGSQARDLRRISVTTVHEALAFVAHRARIGTILFFVRCHVIELRAKRVAMASLLYSFSSPSSPVVWQRGFLSRGGTMESNAAAVSGVSTLLTHTLSPDKNQVRIPSRPTWVELEYLSI